MLSLVLPLLCAGHPLWMECGRWLFAFFTFPPPPVGEAQRGTVFEILTLIGTMQSHPLYLPCCSCDWPYYLQSTYVSDNCPYYLSFHPKQFSQPEYGGNTILRNVDTFNHSAMWKARRRPSSD
jgi:hypothetical protein